MNIKPPSILTLPTSAPGVPQPCTWPLPGVITGDAAQGQEHPTRE